ncbi:MAG: hypothetical protein AAFZ15_20030 [Bacteroidota bacterium]
MSKDIIDTLFGGIPGNPGRRFRSFMQERFSGLEEASRTSKSTKRSVRPSDAGKEEEIDSSLPGALRRLALEEYRTKLKEEASALNTKALTVAPPGNNWVPLGPTSVRKGQATGDPTIAGRTVDLAILPGGRRIYAATANGGVWRSEDAGHSWRPLMDQPRTEGSEGFSFDENPSAPNSAGTGNDGADSLSCGAIAVIPGNSPNEDVIYVGTGERDRGSYVGVGIVTSRNGGRTWSKETSSPSTDGQGYFAMAIHPDNPDVVVAAASNGIYVRNAAGTWNQVASSAGQTVSSVVVAKDPNNGDVYFFAAGYFGYAVFAKNNLNNWNALPAIDPPPPPPPPTDDRRGRTTLAVLPNNPNIVYALMAFNGDPASGATGVEAHQTDNVKGLYRLDRSATPLAWATVENKPPLLKLFGSDPANDSGQGSYDNSMTIAPGNVNRLYLGGSGTGAGAFIIRCVVNPADNSADYKNIGITCHADIHRLVFEQGNSNKLWVGCDGGVFFTDHAAANNVTFLPRNNGLQTMTVNSIALHPSQDGVMIIGTQDNGVQRFTGEEAWSLSYFGDGGDTIIHQIDPFKMLGIYTNNEYTKANNGGRRSNIRLKKVPLLVHTSGGTTTKERVLFYPPMVGYPYKSGDTNAFADLVAYGSERIWISTNFGDSWNPIPKSPGNNLASFNADRIKHVNTIDPTKSFDLYKCITFASEKKLYAGTVKGKVYKFECTNANWTPHGTITKTELLNRAPVAPNPLVPPAPFVLPAVTITSIVIDPGDNSGDSIFITLGGVTSGKRVLHYNGSTSTWTDQSTGLPDAQFNSIVSFNNDLYAGADIGVWKGTKTGASWSWTTFSPGLPDAAVLALKIQPARTVNGVARPALLRAATHGRGIFEISLDGVDKKGAELYVRKTILDNGRYPAELNASLKNPTDKNKSIDKLETPDVKLAVPNNRGTYQFPFENSSDTIDYIQYLEEQNDDWDKVPTHATSIVTSRIFVVLHNRGIVSTDGITVTALLTKATGPNPPNLPAGYVAKIQSKIPINEGGWTTVGSSEANQVVAGFPVVVPINMSSDKLPLPAALAGGNEYFLLILVHHSADVFDGRGVFNKGAAQVANPVVTSDLVAKDRKAVLKKIKIVEFTGRLPVENKHQPLAGYVPIPATATLPHTPFDAFLGDALRQNDDVLSRIFSAAMVSTAATIGNDEVVIEQRGPDKVLVRKNGSSETVTPFDPAEQIKAKTLRLETDIDLKEETPLIWYASEEIKLNAKINGKGKGTKPTHPVSNPNPVGDFGGAGGFGSALGKNCQLPVSGVVIAEGGKGGSVNGADLDEIWASRVALVTPFAKGGAPGGDDGANRGGAGGAIIALAAGRIELTPSAEINVEGANGSGGNGGGGGGGMVLFTTGELVNAVDITTSNTPNVKVAGGLAASGLSGRGGNGLVVRRIFD